MLKITFKHSLPITALRTQSARTQKTNTQRNRYSNSALVVPEYQRLHICRHSQNFTLFKISTIKRVALSHKSQHTPSRMKYKQTHLFFSVEKAKNYSITCPKTTLVEMLQKWWLLSDAQRSQTRRKSKHVTPFSDDLLIVIGWKKC